VIGLLMRRMTLRNAADSFLETVRLVASVIFIVMASTMFSYFIVQTGVANAIADGMQSAGLSGTAVIVILCVIYIVMGCFLEGIAMILITVPITLPLVLSFGYDPVWFGVLLVILIEIGLITPPVGLNVFVIKGIVGNLMSTETIFKGILWFLVADIFCVILLIAFPEITLFLPRLLD